MNVIEKNRIYTAKININRAISWAHGYNFVLKFCEPMVIDQVIEMGIC